MSAKDIAQWMVEKVPERGFLYQERIAREMRRDFGEEYTYRNKNGNWGISKEILNEFRKITPDIVWSRANQAWRRRQPNDPD